MRFIDLFAGIGGFRLGLEMAGHECKGFVEWDKHARASYEAIHDTEGEFSAHDIRNVSDNDLRLLAERERIELITAGFPCQPFSIGGAGRGFQDTRGTVFFEIARFARELRPDFLFLENVPGLLSNDKGRTFETILFTLEELGYNVEWESINARDLDVPQNRQRVYIIAHSRKRRTRKIFPIERVIAAAPTPRESGFKIINNTKKGFDYAGDNDVINIAFPGSNTRRGRVGRGYFQTLDTTCNLAVKDGGRWRKITPREAWRIQGFPDYAFDRAAAVTKSDTQLYKQAGNSVAVPVIYEIGKRLKALEDEMKQETQEGKI